MATQYIGADLSDNLAADVTQDTSTTSKPVELAINDAATGISKLRVLKALEAIRQKILRDWKNDGAV